MERLKEVKNIPKPTYFGKNLKFLRRLKGLSQSKLAEAIGMSRNNIASYESGVVEPNVNKFLEVCKYFDVDPAAMLQQILSDKADDLVASSSSPLDSYLNDHLIAFIQQTNEMTKVLEGYKAFFELKKSSDLETDQSIQYGFLDDLLDLLKRLIVTNWGLIHSVNKVEEEE